MILAAGIGSRLKPLTDVTPKPLLKVNNMTMLEMTMLYLKKHDVKKIVINIHHHAQQIVDYVSKHNGFGVEVIFSDESDMLLNTGGGLVKAKLHLHEAPFILAASDVLTDLDLTAMYNHHVAKNNLVTLAVKERETSRSLLFDEEGLLAGWRNNRTEELKLVKRKTESVRMGFSGVHVISPDFFDKVTLKGNFNIVNQYLELAECERIGMFGHSDGLWHEFGKISSLEQAASNKEVLRLQQDIIK